MRLFFLWIWALKVRNDVLACFGLNPCKMKMEMCVLLNLDDELSLLSWIMCMYEIRTRYQELCICVWMNRLLRIGNMTWVLCIWRLKDDICILSCLVAFWYMFLTNCGVELLNFGLVFDLVLFLVWNLHNYRFQTRCAERDWVATRSANGSEGHVVSVY